MIAQARAGSSFPTRVEAVPTSVTMMLHPVCPGFEVLLVGIKKAAANKGVVMGALAIPIAASMVMIRFVQARRGQANRMRERRPS